MRRTAAADYAAPARDDGLWAEDEEDEELEGRPSGSEGGLSDDLDDSYASEGAEERGPSAALCPSDVALAARTARFARIPQLGGGWAKAKRPRGLLPLAKKGGARPDKQGAGEAGGACGLVDDAWDDSVGLVARPLGASSSSFGSLDDEMTLPERPRL